MEYQDMIHWAKVLNCEVNDLTCEDYNPFQLEFNLDRTAFNKSSREIFHPNYIKSYGIKDNPFTFYCNEYYNRNRCPFTPVPEATLFILTCIYEYNNTNKVRITKVFNTRKEMSTYQKLHDDKITKVVTKQRHIPQELNKVESKRLAYIAINY